MPEWIGTILSSVMGGGLTGIFGVVAQRYFDMKNKQLDIEILDKKQGHEIELRRVDAEIMREEWAARTRVAEVEGETKESVAETSAFSASFNEPVRYSDHVTPNENQGWLLIALDFIRGIVRPGLTVYLCVLTSLIYLHAKNLITENMLSAAQAVDLLKLIIGTVLYLTTTCVLWWFGTRNKQRAPRI
jgi:hypothetical protein